MKESPRRRQQKHVKSILVPTDFSAASKAALEYAIELSRRFEAKIVLMFVVDTAGLALPGTDAYGASAAPLWLSELQRTGKLELAKLARELRRRRCDFETRSCTGVTSQEIVRLAKMLDAEIIVMGTQGRTGLSRLLLGSVAEKVIRLAPCPVLTVPHAVRSRRRR